MKKTCFLAYEAPAVEVIEVEVEKGFAQSNTPTWENQDVVSINDIFEQIWE